MEKMPCFSIIIPTYNRAGRIGKTIRSLLSQDCPDFEIIVVDDGSTDNTEEVVKAFGSKVIYIKKENGERAAARNAGAAAAKGKYINFFDSDDLAYTNHLSEAKRIILQYNEPEVAVVAYDYQDPQGNIEKQISFSDGRLEEKLVYGNILSCEGVFLRKDIADQFPFNEDRALSATEDYELWLRLAARFTFRYSNTITHSVVNHPERSTINTSMEKLIDRKKLFIHYVFSDDEVVRKFGNHKSRLIADCHTYIALHLAIIGGHTGDVFIFLFKAFQTFPPVVTTRRFWGSIKNLI
jgi:glycosyltransferase involved in cell wall biosynthesis